MYRFFSASNVQLSDWLRQIRPQMYSCLIGSETESASNVHIFAISLTFDSNSTSGFKESDVLKMYVSSIVMILCSYCTLFDMGMHVFNDT